MSEVDKELLAEYLSRPISLVEKYNRLRIAHGWPHSACLRTIQGDVDALQKNYDNLRREVKEGLQLITAHNLRGDSRQDITTELCSLSNSLSAKYGVVE